MGSATTYLLDTNVLVALIRAGKLGKHIEQAYQLSAQPFKPLISVVTIGEMMKLAKDFMWGEKKVAQLQGLLAKLVCVDINRSEILDAYAEISHITEKEVGKKPQNDYWIAATAKVTGAVLLTTDADFDHLHEKYIRRIFIDEGQGKT